jgi:hypothetical protein
MVPLVMAAPDKLVEIAEKPTSSNGTKLVSGFTFKDYTRDWNGAGFFNTSSAPKIVGRSRFEMRRAGKVSE